MKKITSIHLNGKAFLLEEEGYSLLEASLATAERRSKDSPDKADIMKDLEQSIADKFSAYLSLTKDVVLTDEVKQVLIEMAPATASPAEPTNATNDRKNENPRPQKLQTSVKTDSELSVIWDDFASLIGIGGLTLFFLLCWIVSAISILLSSRFFTGTAHPFLSFLLVLLVTTCAIYVVYWPIRLIFEKWHKSTYGTPHPKARDSREILTGSIIWVVALVIFLIIL